MYNNNYYFNKRDIAEKKPKKKPVKKILRQSIERKHFDFLMDQIEKRELDEKMRFNKKLLNVLMYFTGLRLNEVLLLNKEDLEELIRDGRLKVYCSKTKEDRKVYIQKSCKKIFLSYFKDGLYDKIHKNGIVNQFDRKATTRNAHYWMNKYWTTMEEKYPKKNKSVPGREWGMHSYRVNFINQIIRSTNIDKAASMIGHKNILTTLIYYRKMGTTEEEYVDIMERASF